MNVGRRRQTVTILAALAIMLLLVPALGWMQYGWLGQLSTAERERMHRTLRIAAAQFATDFDTEVSRILVSLQVDGATLRDQNWRAYAERYSVWATSASDPRIVRDVWLVDTLPGAAELPVLGSGEVIPADRLRIRKWNNQAFQFDQAEWPADLAVMRDSLAARFIGFQVQRSGPRGSADVHRETSFAFSNGDDNVLVAPVTLFELNDERRGPPRISVLGFTIVRLEPAVIRDTMLAALTSRHFHGGDQEVDYRLAVVRRDDPTSVVWESEPGVAKLIMAAPDVTQTFMAPRPDQMFVFTRNLRGDGIPPPPPPPPPAPGNDERTAATWQLPAPKVRIEAKGTDSVVVQMIEEDSRGGGGKRLITRSAQAGAPFNGRWTLMAKHRAGSLEAAVGAARTRNLAISSSVLLLLIFAVSLIVTSAGRAEALARQQMEFVAAVSHELRTPVSVIGAAAGNLADGVVGDPQRVRKYGETIQSEARRLAETVERVLQLAGIAAGHAAATQVPVSPSDLVHESIAACRHEIDSAGVNVEVAVADNLPNVVGDVTALKSALQNLISNAVKYGGDARWVRVSASMTPPPTGKPQTVMMIRNRGKGQLVVFAVEDRGMGIAAEDSKHIFEPFYRGRDAVSQQIQGSGLGLNLVLRIATAHGGAVTVSSEPGKGSTFTLALPAVHDRLSAEYAGADLQTRPTT